MGERQDSQLKDGRDVAIHHAGSPAPGAPVLVMHYGTPHTGKHPPPIDQLAAAVGLRLVSVTRPGFAGSSRRAGRTVSDAAEDIIEVLDRLNVGRMVTAGYSGGGPHALALAALAPDRVDHAATFGCPAPYDQTPDWFTGMAANGGGLRPAAEGPEARERYQRTAEFDPGSFTAADWAALSGPWAGIGDDAQSATAAGSAFGEIDDDLALVAPWGVDLDRITTRVSVFHAASDRVIPAHHAERLAALLPSAGVRSLEASGHVAVLGQLPQWMRAVAPHT
ncbi:alpha/beta fold hydrolase [Pseudactinotalea sp. Z1732]|uniref:alpha/beta fold hydrolase n=1 Tax=Pseudactinotalea sp. Z1732 TaxID=3413026 RepID=UPI003C7C85CA